jgi:hypothetical protein
MRTKSSHGFDRLAAEFTLLIKAKLDATAAAVTFHLCHHVRDVSHVVLPQREAEMAQVVLIHFLFLCLHT